MMEPSVVFRIRLLSGLAAVSVLVVLAVPGVSPQAGTPPVPPPNPFRADPVRSGELSNADVIAYRAAFAAGQRHFWETVPLLLAPVQDRRLVPVLDWLRIRNGRQDDPDAIRRFIAEQPDLPGHTRLAIRLEEAVLATEDAAAINAHFANRPALTRQGKLHLALAQKASDPAGATKIARDLWRDADFDLADERRLLSGFRSGLTAEDHAARLDRLLWSKHRAAATRMLSLVPDDLRRLAKARLALMYRRPNVDSALAAVPAHLQRDAGLLYDRTRWRRRAGRHEGAQEILLSGPDHGARPDLWWIERRIQIRQLLADDAYEKAWRIASEHGMERGAAFAQGEFEAGWIALRYLDRPRIALRHFETLFDNVAYPVSRARGAYWIARAHQALQDPARATEWFRRAATHVGTYYGQLGRLAIGGGRLELPEEPAISAAARAEFDQLPLVQITRLLVEVGQDHLARRFLTHMGQSATGAERRLLLGDMAQRLDRADLQVLAGKLAALDQVMLPSITWPLNADLTGDLEVGPALAHAIARQESAFNPKAVSHAGARGLMQLMPGTARLVARETEAAYQPRRLTDDPAYNARLGSTYLAWQIRDFDGYLPMAIAAYNAGPHRVKRWIEAHGDPRNGTVDPVDWVERIPFSETRNYVQRVLESLQVYRVRMEGGHDLRLARDLGIRSDGLRIVLR
ncbi:MAG: lytic transglycosylase domain-containing protein [Minwuia sp.]|nr:lytic transglycosylase domain-containing protein [Minwuia sp.]